jgi:hypothetical protein
MPVMEVSCAQLAKKVLQVTRPKSTRLNQVWRATSLCSWKRKRNRHLDRRGEDGIPDFGVSNLNSQRGLTFLEFIILLGIIAVLLAVSGGLYSQIFAQQRQLDEKAEIVNLTGQLSILRQSSSICSCNIARLPSFDTQTLADYKASMPSLQIWDPTCSSATSTLIATESSGLTPNRSVKAQSIDLSALVKITDSIYKLDLKIPLIGKAAELKPLVLKNLLVYTQSDPPTEPSSRRRKILGCVPLTGPGEHLLLVDQKPAGTPGGTCQAYKWNRRVFTRVLMDDHGIVSTPRDKDGMFSEPAALTDVPLKAGTYTCELTASVNYAWSNTQARLVNADTGETLLLGTSESTGAQKPSAMRSVVKGRFTLPSASHVRLESFIATARSAELNTQSNCLGDRAQSGAPEVFSTLDCWRLP